MSEINAYIHFNGKCREAMEFYKECLGGELSITPISETPMAKQMAPDSGHRVAHATLISGSLVLSGSDMNAPEGYIKGNNITLSMNCSTEEELNKYFTNLSAGGKVNHQPSEMFWGGIFAALYDKYDIEWVFNFDKNANK